MESRRVANPSASQALAEGLFFAPMADTVLLRIRPHLPREVHVFQGKRIVKSKGWHAVSPDFAAAAAREPFSDLDPASQLLFEIRTVSEARQVEKAERERADVEIGTADTPISLLDPEDETTTDGSPDPIRPARSRKAPEKRDPK